MGWGSTTVAGLPGTLRSTGARAGGLLTGQLTGRLTAQYARAAGAVDYVERMARKSEELLDETLAVVRATRPVVTAVADAVDDGLLDELRTTVRQTRESMERVNRVSTQIEQTLPRVDATALRLGRTLPLVDRAARAVGSAVPAVSALPSTQDEVRMAREATERLVGLVDTALEQLDALPGARMVRRRLVRPAVPVQPPQTPLTR